MLFRSGDFLILFLALDKLLIVTVGDGLGELVRVLDFVELLLDRLPKFQVIHVFQNEQGLRTFAKFLQSAVERMLFGIGIQALEELRGGGHFQPDGGEEAQDFIPLLLD